MSDSGKGDAEKARYWQRTISEAARSGISIREYCRRHRLKESQFYWWQRRLHLGRGEGSGPRPTAKGQAASFALVSEEAGAMDAGVELVLSGGRRLRITKGVDEVTLRTVLAALEPAGC
jgi:transposase-like protein